MSMNLYWADGPWSGKLALAARPHGGDWLGDEIASWRRAGVNIVFSLLTSEEERDLGLGDEAIQVKSRGLQFLSFPITDREVPDSSTKVAAALEKLDADLSSGRNVVVHCRQGIGRTGLMAACLLVMKGLKPEAAVKSLSTARGISVPETAAQRRWIDHYATTLAGTK
jgi:protein-tyrosine phosphatase